MKKVLSILLVLFAMMAVNAQTVIYSENFDALTAGQSLLSQSDQWTTWSGGVEAESGTIINTFYQSAPNALQIQGSNDMLYKTNGLTSGHYTFDFDYYIPSIGNGGYFNLQHVNKTTWAFECYFGHYVDAGTDYGPYCYVAYDDTFALCSYVENSWFHVNVDVNMDQDLAKLTFNGEEVASWQFSTIPDTTNNTSNRLDAINFFAGCLDNAMTQNSTLTGTYYVDNFVFTKLDGVGVTENETAEVKVFPNPANSVLNVTTGNANTLEIVNFIGQVVYTQPVNADQVQINVSDLSSGVYFVRLKGETTITKKFIKE